MRAIVKAAVKAGLRIAAARPSSLSTSSFSRVKALTTRTPVRLSWRVALTSSRRSCRLT